MVRVTLTIVVHPQRRAELISALRSLILPLQAAPGYNSCRLCQEAENPDTLCYEEEWRTPEDLDRRIRSNHYTWLLEIMEQAAKPPEFRLSWVTEVKGLEYIDALRARDRCATMRHR